MTTATKNLTDLSAADIMNVHVVRVPEQMPLREAVPLVIRAGHGGAAVVDHDGRCVGMLSTANLIRLDQQHDLGAAHGVALPVTCSFQTKYRLADNSTAILCTLPEGMCPIQSKRQEPDGRCVLVCSQPHAVPTDWQVVRVEDHAEVTAAECMTPNPVTVSPDTPVSAVARKLIDRQVHRLLVLDQDQRPVGIISSTDLLAAMADSGEEHER